MHKIEINFSSVREQNAYISGSHSTALCVTCLTVTWPQTFVHCFLELPFKPVQQSLLNCTVNHVSLVTVQTKASQHSR